MGFAAGVMIAASFWSLLAPALKIAEGGSLPSWVPALIGFVSGAVILSAIDKILPHLHLGFSREEAEGIPTSWKRAVLLVTAVTLHNLPEGLAIGVAFGAAATGVPEASIGGAVALALGIGIQNLPEGTALAMPLRAEGMSRFKAFTVGQLSAIVEPVGAVIGAAAVSYATGLLPYALSFAAGAMIFVVVEELVPESQRLGHTDIATLGAVAGFALMMVLDTALS